MAITLQRIGQRVYFAGDTFAAKDLIKALGGHWDGETRQWWVGAAKATEAERLIAADPTEAKAEDIDAAKVRAKVSYKGRTYYVIAETSDRCRLATLDNAPPPFWTDMSACELVRTYEPRTVGHGRYARTEYQSIGSLRRFRDRQADAKASGAPQCPICGRRGPLTRDMEDGIDKCHGCCDMPV